MVTRAQSQPDHVQVDFWNTFQGKPGFVHTSLRQIVNNQYPCRLVYNQSISDLNILKQEMLATSATWKGWLAASDSCKPVIPGKSYAEVLKTDSQLQCMHSFAKKWGGHPARALIGQTCWMGVPCTHQEVKYQFRQPSS